VPQVASEIARAEALFPGKPVEPLKAWLEMIHRYFATGLGFLILILCALAWKNRKPGTFPLLPTALVGLVVFQGMLGMWTVTLLLKPVIVSLHLLGGLATFSVLSLMALKETKLQEGPPIAKAIRLMALFGLLALIGQIALGAWTSTNYAALACGDIPLCQGQWMPEGLDFKEAFRLERPLGYTADGQVLSMWALTAIHWVHRVGALVVTLVLTSLGVLLLVAPGLKRFGFALLGALALQLSIGLSLVHWQFPLPLAVMHNGGAALLLLVMVTVVTVTWTRPQSIQD
jgi:cytochrome c oxidase assembly protein subunit 15